MMLARPSPLQPVVAIGAIAAASVASSGGRGGMTGGGSRSKMASSSSSGTSSSSVGAVVVVAPGSVVLVSSPMTSAGVRATPLGVVPDVIGGRAVPSSTVTSPVATAAVSRDPENALSGSSSTTGRATMATSQISATPYQRG
jgi:hypothetical protein